MLALCPANANGGKSANRPGLGRGYTDGGGEQLIDSRQAQSFDCFIVNFCDGEANTVVRSFRAGGCHHDFKIFVTILRQSRRRQDRQCGDRIFEDCHELLLRMTLHSNAVTRRKTPDRPCFPARAKDWPQQAGLLAPGSLLGPTFPFAQWSFWASLAGHSCGYSAGLPPASLFTPVSRGTCYEVGG